MGVCRSILAAAWLAAFGAASQAAPVSLSDTIGGGNITSSGTAFTHTLSLPGADPASYTLDAALLSLTFQVSNNAAAQNDTISLFLGGTEQASGIAATFGVTDLDVSSFYDIVTGVLSFELFRGVPTGGGNIQLTGSTLSLTATPFGNGNGNTGGNLPPEQLQVPEPGTLVLLGLGLLGITMVRRRTA